MKKLNDYFKNLDYSKFLLISAIIIYLSDFLNIFYINLHFLPTKIDMNYIYKMLYLQGNNPNNFDPTYLMELRLVIINTMKNVFYLFLVYHAFVYFMYRRGKTWGRKYVYGYAFTGAILTIIELPFLIQRHIGWAIAMLITTAIYIYVWYGIRHYKKAGIIKD
tara:strand:+ start:33895 stop:34383 length:489 start_codon:yes stop_codon:yes gene_type:complete